MKIQKQINSDNEKRISEEQFREAKKSKTFRKAKPGDDIGLIEFLSEKGKKIREGRSKGSVKGGETTKNIFI